MTYQARASLHDRSISPADLIETSVDDKQDQNGVLRVIARGWLPFRIGLMLLSAFWVVVMGYVTTEAGLTYFLGSGEDGDTFFIGLIAFAFLIRVLWKEAQVFGHAIALATRPLDTTVEGVPGVTLGPLVIRATEDALSWEHERSREDLHLNAFRRIWRRGRFVLLLSNLVETHFVPSLDTALWTQHLRERKSQASKSGWDLPEAGFQHFRLSREAFDAEEKRHEQSVEESTLGIALTLLWFAATAFFLATALNPLERDFTPVSAFVSGALAALLGFLFFVQLRRLIDARRIGGFDRAIEGIAYGPTAYRIASGRIDIRRALRKQWFDVDVLTEAEQRDGLLALRAGGMTLALLPDTEPLRDALEESGLTQIKGPWKRADGAFVWTRES